MCRSRVTPFAAGPDDRLYVTGACPESSHFVGSFATPQKRACPWPALARHPPAAVPVQHSADEDGDSADSAGGAADVSGVAALKVRLLRSF